jgi:hypothetical protein
LDKHLTQIAQTPDKLHYNRGIGTGAVHTRGGKDYESVTDEDFMDEGRIVRGDKLHPDARKEALSRYVHRWTHENSKQNYGGKCPACVQGASHAAKNGMSQEQWHNHHDPMTSDHEWMKSHAFHVKKNGMLSNKHHNAEPHYMANESVTDEDFLDEAKGPSCWSALSVPCRGKAGEKCNRCGHTVKTPKETEKDWVHGTNNHPGFWRAPHDRKD